VVNRKNPIYILLKFKSRYLQNAYNMDCNYPPTYIMHCQDDDSVHSENAERLAGKLKELGVPCFLQAVSVGGYGIGLANDTPAEDWVTEAVQFWQAQC
jgi:predicted esterase